MIFKDRFDAGSRLSLKLQPLYRPPNIVVFGLPKGGVVVACTVASRLGAPLDVVVTKKLGHPSNPEFALGALAEGGVFLLDQHEAAHVSREWIDAEWDEKAREMAISLRQFEALPRHPDLSGQTAIVIDDGAATGLTMQAAVLSLRKRHPDRIVVALPVAPASTSERLETVADEVITLETPDALFAVGKYFRDFAPVCDEQVAAILHLPHVNA